MTSRYDLIEEAAEAILDAAETPEYVRDEQIWAWARRDAEAALSVFEKAHTPTEDYPDAEWQAARTPQITDEMVLAAVGAFRDGSFGNDYIDMRIALEAALEAALGQTNDTKEETA